MKTKITIHELANQRCPLCQNILHINELSCIESNVSIPSKSTLTISDIYHTLIIEQESGKIISKTNNASYWNSAGSLTRSLNNYTLTSYQSYNTSGIIYYPGSATLSASPQTYSSNTCGTAAYCNNTGSINNYITIQQGASSIQSYLRGTNSVYTYPQTFTPAMPEGLSIIYLTSTCYNTDNHPHNFMYNATLSVLYSNDYVKDIEYTSDSIISYFTFSSPFYQIQRLFAQREVIVTISQADHITEPKEIKLPLDDRSLPEVIDRMQKLLAFS